MAFSLNYLKQFRFEKSLSFTLDRIIDAGTPDEFNDNFSFDFDQEGAFSVFAPAIGVNLTQRLALGITLNIWNDSITGDSEYTEKVTNRNIANPDGVEEDIIRFTQNRFEVDDGNSFVLGGMYQINKQLTLGIVYKPEFTLDLGRESIVSGTFVADNGPFKNDVDLQMPNILGAGISWRPEIRQWPDDRLTFALDVTWTDWSEYILEEDNGDQKNPVTGRNLDEGKLDDTYTCRFGVEYLVVKQDYIVPFRLGVGYDPEPALDDVDDFFTLSFGTGIQWGIIMFDVGYEFRWGNNVGESFLRGVNGEQDIQQHRVLASVIVYGDWLQKYTKKILRHTSSE